MRVELRSSLFNFPNVGFLKVLEGKSMYLFLKNAKCTFANANWILNKSDIYKFECFTLF